MWIDAGYDIQLNLGETPDHPTTFTREIARFRRFVNQVLDKYQPSGKIIMVSPENEPPNNQYYSEEVKYHFPVMNATASICLNRNIPTVYGGMITEVKFGLHDYYKRNNDTASIQWLEATVGRLYPNSPNYASKLAEFNVQADTILASDLTFNNFHYKEERPSGYIIRAKAFLEERVKKPCITNEGGFMTTNNTYIQQTMQEAISAGYKYYFIMDPEGVGGVGVPQMTPEGEKTVGRVVAGNVSS